MSLKAFHVVFIGAAILLALVMAAWCFGEYREDGRVIHVVWSCVSLAAAGGLAVYEWVFLKKKK
jgi:hypothetical protein